MRRFQSVRCATAAGRLARGAAILAAAACLTGAAEPTAQGQQPTRTGPAAQAGMTPAPRGGYAYDPAGRRDPFASLLGRGADLRGPAVRPEGVPGLRIDEVTVKGILASRGSYVAIVQAPDNKTYTVRAGDKLLDGAVRAVSADAIVFVQQVSDPLSLVKQREVRKSLRSVEEGK